MIISRIIRRFFKSQKGNVAMVTALVAVPMIGLLGGAVDLVRMNQIRSEIQGAVDAGVLAISELSNKNDPETTIRQFVKANLHSSSINPSDINLVVAVQENLNAKTVTVNASYSMKTYFLGVIGMNNLDINLSSAGTQSYADLEIAIVLDISRSMNGTKFGNMQTAAKEFVATVLTDAVKDKTTISIVPFSSNVNVGDNYWEFVKKNTVDNNHDTNFYDGHIWDGCVEFGSGDFNDSKPTANSLPVMPRWYGNGWRYCPESNNEVLYLSNTKATLDSKITGLSVSQTTSLDVGALVGLKALSPSMKGHLKGDQQAKHPAAYDSGTLKVLIFMTDGEATNYENPNNGCDTSSDIWVSTGYNSGYWKECTYVKRSAATIRSNFTATCNAAKDKGITIYTIGFQITEGGNSDLLLEDCATTASHYYYVESTDIGAAFRSIAASINGVRLTL